MNLIDIVVVGIVLGERNVAVVGASVGVCGGRVAVCRATGGRVGEARVLGRREAGHEQHVVLVGQTVPLPVELIELA